MISIRYAPVKPASRPSAVSSPPGAASDPRDLYAAWRFFFERLASQQLTVLVFEDLQWADSGLLDFIEYLLEWSRNSPILIVTLARPELAERRPGWGTGKRGLTSLYLESLAPEAIARHRGRTAPDASAISSNTVAHFGQ